MHSFSFLKKENKKVEKCPGVFISQRYLCLLFVLLFFVSGCGCYKPHIIRRGETIGVIAQNYSMSEEALRRANHLGSSNKIYAGEKLFVACSATEHRTSSSKAPAVKKRTVKKRVANKKTTDTATKKRPTQKKTKPKYVKPKKKAPRPPKAKGNYGWPVKGKVVRSFSNSSAAATKGIDIRAKNGARVSASQNGRVEYAGSPANAYGFMVLLKHTGGYYTVYSNLGSVKVSSGQVVNKGEKIGTSGKESYLHFELRKGRKAVDPLLYLP
jgi:murein DD-endopeptidase MepM/ murein hydrolase activator NlpD